MKNRLTYIVLSGKIASVLLFTLILIITPQLYGQDSVNKMDVSFLIAKINKPAETALISDRQIENVISEESGEAVEFLNMEEFNTVIVQNGDVQKAMQNNDDSLQCIENLLGVKLETSSEKKGGIKIISVNDNSIFSANSDKVKSLTIRIVAGGSPVMVKTTSDFTKVLYDLYNKGISKVNFLTSSGVYLSKYSTDKLGIDISDISKCQSSSEFALKPLSIDESRIAGSKVAKYYKTKKVVGQTWGSWSILNGLALGLPGTAALTVASVVVPIKDYIPDAPPNVNADAWKSGYRSRIKATNVRGTIVAGLVGTLISVLVVNGVCK